MTWNAMGLPQTLARMSFVSAASHIDEGRPLLPALWLGMPTELNLFGVV